MAHRSLRKVSQLVTLGVLSLVISSVSCRQAKQPPLMQQVVSTTTSTAPPSHEPPITEISSALKQATPIKLPALLALEQETISVNGLGPIRIGMTIEDAEAAAKVEFIQAPGSERESCQYYLPKDMPETLGLMVISGRVIRIDIWPGSPIKTTQGIGIGSTETDVQAGYPGYISIAPKPLKKGNYLTFDPAEGGINLYQIVFETDSYGRVTEFRAGQFPAVSWMDGCS